MRLYNQYFKCKMFGWFFNTLVILLGKCDRLLLSKESIL